VTEITMRDALMYDKILEVDGIIDVIEHELTFTW
jgi:hypothetical protein